MTREQLIAAARARLATHGSSSPVMREMRALLEALDAARQHIKENDVLIDELAEVEAERDYYRNKT